VCPPRTQPRIPQRQTAVVPPCRGPRHNRRRSIPWSPARTRSATCCSATRPGHVPPLDHPPPTPATRTPRARRSAPVLPPPDIPPGPTPAPLRPGPAIPTLAHPPLRAAPTQIFKTAPRAPWRWPRPCWPPQTPLPASRRLPATPGPLVAPPISAPILYGKPHQPPRCATAAGSIAAPGTRGVVSAPGSPAHVVRARHQPWPPRYRPRKHPRSRARPPTPTPLTSSDSPLSTAPYPRVTWPDRYLRACYRSSPHFPKGYISGLPLWVISAYLPRLSPTPPISRPHLHR
jgi:hypothetical protein